FGKRSIVFENIGVVGELGRRADVVAEHVLRGRNPGDERQMVDERAAVVGASRPLGVELGKLRVLLLVRVARLGDRLLGSQSRGGGADCGGGEQHARARCGPRAAGANAGRIHEASRSRGPRELAREEHEGAPALGSRAGVTVNNTIRRAGREGTGAYASSPAIAPLAWPPARDSAPLAPASGAERRPPSAR